MTDTLFFFRIVDDKPEVFPITGSTRHLTLDGEDFILIPISKSKSKPIVPADTSHKRKDTRPYPKDRISEFITNSGQSGVSPLEIRNILKDVWPVALGPILAQLVRDQKIIKLSNGNWAPR